MEKSKFGTLLPMISQNIRRKFLQYFKDKGHTVVPSSPVIPHDDPSLLFNNAGMNQFKDVFLGKDKRDYTKAASSQKCIRAGGKHNDLENVGHTSRHLTFFEMLGNFSFGDYGKKEAIAYAYEVTTQVFEFDPALVYASVLHNDDESFELWKAYLPENRIVRMTEKDNFWAMGETGPCGPCSELYYDKGHDFGPALNPVQDTSGERFIEFWNLVFMQFNRKSASDMSPLPKLSVDTGSGLERVVSLKMGVDSVFKTDILRELIAEIENHFHTTYSQENAPAYHVIADHLRTLAFAIADGAKPSNIERGYVLRKILRRAVRYGKILGAHKPFLADILPRLTKTMGDDYPELKVSQNIIAEILTVEEENFLRTLKKGGQLLDNIMHEARKAQRPISGLEAFKLKDTYGLPLDEIMLIATDEEVKVDVEGFEKLEEEAKERSRKTKKETGEQYSLQAFENVKSIFDDCHQLQAKVIHIIQEGQSVDSIVEGDEALIILDKTPFYAEKGGQIGDQGVLQNADLLFKVQDTQTPFTGVIVHKGLLQKGTLKVNDLIEAKIEESRRQKIANNHTATHLLHLALQKVLGSHIKQAGSVVEPTRLRFDFNHHKPLSKEEIEAIEKDVNAMIRHSDPIKTYEMTLEEASQKKEIKQFFGEKYGKTVRVVEAGQSKELCGGTHTKNTGTIGFFKISKESSISAGVRRIEAVTGVEAEEIVKEQETIFAHLAELLKVQPPQVVEKIEKLLQENKDLNAQKQSLAKEILSLEVENLRKKIQKTGEVSYLFQEVPSEPKTLSELLLEKEPSLACLLISQKGQNVTFVAKISPDLVQKGLKAQDLLKVVGDVLGGKGGGKADFAQGGGTLPQNIAEALKLAQKWIEPFSKT